MKKDTLKSPNNRKLRLQHLSKKKQVKENLLELQMYYIVLLTKSFPLCFLFAGVFPHDAYLRLRSMNLHLVIFLWNISLPLVLGITYLIVISGI